MKAAQLKEVLSKVNDNTEITIVESDVYPLIIDIDNVRHFWTEDIYDGSSRDCTPKECKKLESQEEIQTIDNE